METPSCEISGLIRPPNGSAQSGVTVTATRPADGPSELARYTYEATTDVDGYFRFKAWPGGEIRIACENSTELDGRKVVVPYTETLFLGVFVADNL